MLKAPQLAYSVFDENVIVFAPHTGQTHNLDENAYQVLQLLSETKPSSIEQLIDKLAINNSPEEKTLLSNYINDIINSLLAIELISIAT